MPPLHGINQHRLLSTSTSFAKEAKEGNIPSSSDLSAIEKVPLPVCEKLKKIADDLIRKRENLPKLEQNKILAEEELEKLNNSVVTPNENKEMLQLMKKNTEENLVNIHKEAEAVNEKITALSEKIQTIEEKREKRTQANARRLANFEKFFDEHTRAQKKLVGFQLEKNEFEQKNSEFEKEIVNYENNPNLKEKSKKVEIAIEEIINEKARELYVDLIGKNDITSLRKKGINNDDFQKLLVILNDFTKVPLTEREHLKRRMEQYSLYINGINYVANPVIVIASLAGAYKAIMPLVYEGLEIQKTHDKMILNGKINDDILKDIHSQVFRTWDEIKGIAFAATALAVAALIVCFMIKKFLQKEILSKDNTKNLPDEKQRILKKSLINTLKNRSTDEQKIFKFIFGMVQHADKDFFSIPIDHMAKEATRLVVLARSNPTLSVEKEAINEVGIERFLNTLKKSLDKKLKNLNERNPDFEFYTQFSQLFNEDNHNNLIKGARSLIIDIAKEIIKTDNGKSEFSEKINKYEVEKNEAISSFHNNISNIKKEKSTIEEKITEKAEEIKKIEAAKSQSLNKMNGVLTVKELEEFVRNNKTTGDSGAISGILSKEVHEEYTQEKINKIRAEQQAEEKALLEYEKKHAQASKDYFTLKKRLEAQEKQLVNLEMQLKIQEAQDYKKEFKEKLEKDIKNAKEKIIEIQNDERSLMLDVKSVAYNLTNLSENAQHIKKIFTPLALHFLLERHLGKSEEELIIHAGKNGYASNYLSVAHLLKSGTDALETIQQSVDSGQKKDSSKPNRFYSESKIVMAEGISKKFPGKQWPSTASMVDVIEENGQYKIAHMFGYVPRNIWLFD